MAAAPRGLTGVSRLRTVALLRMGAAALPSGQSARLANRTVYFFAPELCLLSFATLSWQGPQ
jgi:hypothetical protein